ncbi:uncharacterized protein LOC133914337 [Phragmites australis]|uniref:uncharacterized protein LOC133914337 n=1 Tax=Phragmites australis TaxID=29695 RepID=UPI002D76D332|nr:uncharacterized protein LOC133914337 [Phragmites australis]
MVVAQMVMIESLVKWKLEVEAFVAKLKEEMGDLRTQLSRITCNPILGVRPINLPPIFSRLGKQQSERNPEEVITDFKEEEPRPDGRSLHDDYQGFGNGVAFAPLLSSSKGGRDGHGTMQGVSADGALGYGILRGAT